MRHLDDADDVVEEAAGGVAAGSHLVELGLGRRLAPAWTWRWAGATLGRVDAVIDGTDPDRCHRNPRGLAEMNSSATEILLVRHGETTENRSETLQGQDPRRGRLTALGCDQARRVGRRLRRLDFDRVAVSPLERAVLTLGLVLEAREGDGTWPLDFCDDLREIDLGGLHGAPRAAWLAGAAAAGSVADYRPPGGESWNDLQRRVGGWFDRELRVADARRVLIVAHGGVIRALLTWVLRLPMAMPWAGLGRTPGLRNGAICRVVLDGDGDGAPEVWADDTRHLADLDSGAGAGVHWSAGAAAWRPLHDDAPYIGDR